MTLEQGFWLLVSWNIKATVALLLAWAIAALLRNRPAAWRHAVWSAGILVILVVPLLEMWTPTLPEPEWASSVVAGVKRIAVEPAPGDAMQVSAVPGQRTPDWPKLATLLWLCGALLFTALVSYASWKVARARVSAEPLFLSEWILLADRLGRHVGLRRPVRLLLATGTAMPCTWGVFRPVILLPASATSWPEDRRRVVLLHELAHIARRDWLLHMLGAAARVLYWANPLVWCAVARLRQEGEHACDDCVLNTGIDAPEYAEQLLHLARTLRVAPQLCPVSLAMARPTHLERRFLAMLNPALHRTGLTRRGVYTTGMLAFLMAFTLAAWKAPGQAATGRLIGVLKDPSGAVVPNATVIAINHKNQTRDMTTSGSDGRFEFPALPVAVYEITVLKPGFARYLGPNVEITGGAANEFSAVLSLGSITEQMDIVGQGVPRDQSSSVSSGPPQRIRVGGSVQGPKMIKQVRPVYPPAAKAAGITGSVLMDAIVGKEGQILALRVVNTQVDPDLAKAAVEAVSQWQYQPTLLNGAPVEVMTQITVNFTLAP